MTHLIHTITSNNIIQTTGRMISSIVAHISRYKYIYGIILLLGLFILLHTGDIAWAQDVSTAASTDSPVATQQAFEALYNYLDIALKFLYIMLWPLLFIVGLAMDNALVLGQAFHLDAALFQFWQMATNLANFALGGLVMYQIFTLLVGQSDTKKVLNVFKNALFAGIGIQASWFIFISLLDLSTIATYAIGALPTSILGDMQSAEDSYVLNNNISFDFDQTSAEKMISNNYSCPAEPNKRLQECYIYDGFIVGSINEELQEGLEPINNYCVYDGTDVLMTDKIIPLSSAPNTVDFSKIKEASFINTQANIDKIIALGNTTVPATIADADTTFISYEKALLAGETRQKNTGKCLTIANVVQQSKKMTGPLITMYTSMLDFGSFTQSTNKEGIAQITVLFLVKAFIALMLIAPLVALGYILLRRVAYLWFCIVASPFAILKAVFKDTFSRMGESDTSSMMNLDLGEIVKAIFFPVIVVFAFSISFVFMHALNTGLSPSEKTQTYEALDITAVDNDGCTTIQGYFEMCFIGSKEQAGFSQFLDYFSWILVQLFGIGLMWTILFASMQTSSVLGGAAGKIKELATSAVMSAPIIPGLGGSMIGLGALQKTPDKVKNALTQNINTDATDLTNRITGKSGYNTMLKSFEEITDTTDKGRKAIHQVIDNNLNHFNKYYDSDKGSNNYLNINNTWSAHKQNDERKVLLTKDIPTNTSTTNTTGTTTP